MFHAPLTSHTSLRKSISPIREPESPCAGPPGEPSHVPPASESCWLGELGVPAVFEEKQQQKGSLVLWSERFVLSPVSRQKFNKLIWAQKYSHPFYFHVLLRYNNKIECKKNPSTMLSLWKCALVSKSETHIELSQKYLKPLILDILITIAYRERSNKISLRKFEFYEKVYSQKVEWKENLW